VNEISLIQVFEDISGVKLRRQFGCNITMNLVIYKGLLLVGCPRYTEIEGV
jgi:hypothetical protein